VLLPFSISEVKYKIQKCRIEGQICLLMRTRFSTDVKKTWFTIVTVKLLSSISAKCLVTFIYINFQYDMKLFQDIPLFFSLNHKSKYSVETFGDRFSLQLEFKLHTNVI